MNENFKCKTYSRRDNILIHGLPKETKEKLEARVLELYNKGGVLLDSRAIVSVLWLGKFIKSRTRSVIVRFHHYKTSHKFFTAAKILLMQVSCNQNISCKDVLFIVKQALINEL